MEVAGLQSRAWVAHPRGIPRGCRDRGRDRIEIEIAPTILFGDACLYTLCRPGVFSIHSALHRRLIGRFSRPGEVSALRERRRAAVERLPALLPDFSDRRWILPFLHPAGFADGYHRVFRYTGVWRVVWALAGFTSCILPCFPAPLIIVRAAPKEALLAFDPAQLAPHRLPGQGRSDLPAGLWCCCLAVPVES